MKKIKFSPIFLIACVFVIFSGKALSLLFAFIALFIHETSHFLCAKIRGYSMENLTITPFGATMSMSGLSEFDEFFVTVSGPLSNLICCVICGCLWWFFPFLYTFTKAFFYSSLALAIFNLLPLFPFDGGRIILSLVKNKLKFLKISKILSFGFAFIFLGLGIFTAIQKCGYTLIFASAVLIYTNVIEVPKQRFFVIFSSHGVFSPTYLPYEKRTLFIGSDAPLGVLIKAINKKNVRYDVVVVSGNKKVLVPYENLVNLLYKNRKQTVGQAISTLP